MTRSTREWKTTSRTEATANATSFTSSPGFPYSYDSHDELRGGPGDDVIDTQRSSWMGDPTSIPSRSRAITSSMAAKATMCS